jgi:hypothetical protein
MPAEALKWTLKISTQLGISLWAKVDLNPEQLVLLIAQLEPGNTSTEITLPDSTMELYNLGYSPESITDALYKAALIVKRQSDAAIKNSKLKLKHRQQHLQKQRLKEQLKRKLRMRKDLLQKRGASSCSKSSRSRKQNKDPQPQKIDLKERMTIL